jgi:hypothetical protein
VGSGSMNPFMFDAVDALSEMPDDALCVVLVGLILRDMLDASTHMLEDVGWTPVTTEYAKRLRELNRDHGLWDEEPQSIRHVLDGARP